jgi:hypothetical protein
MRAGQAIDNKFEHLYINYEKANVNEQVQNGRYDILEHFTLTKGHQNHVLKPLTFTVGDFVLLAKPDVVSNKHNPLSDEVPSHRQCDEKSYLLKDHSVLGLILHTM